MASPIWPIPSETSPPTRPGLVVILATGGTIAGTAARSDQHHAYQSAQLGIADLVAAVPELAAVPLDTEQVAQVDSKDMSPEIWVTLARRVAHHLARPDVAGVVITHGTDTLEETAIFLELALAHRCEHRPVVLTAAMRPATSSQADGPQNLADAVAVARWSMSRGILAVMAGIVWRGLDVRKVHGHRLDAFSGGDAAPWARIDAGVPVRLQTTSAPELPHPPMDLADLPARNEDWPWVEIVTSHAGASGRGVKAWVAAGVRGLVVAATGNGTVHHALLQALEAAQRSGVVVWRATRCVAGGWVADEAESFPTERTWPASGCALTPAQARVALQWQLLTRP